MSEFERVAPESVGIDSAAVLNFLKEEKKAGVELHSFMIVRHGKVAAEGWAKPYSKEKRHTMFSFSKTLTAIAIGFAVQEKILTLDEKLADIFPEYCPPVLSDNAGMADVRSLLTMSCGHRTEMTMAEAERFQGDWIRAFMTHPFVFEPGKVFQYNTWGTDMLSAILQKKTGRTLTEFLTPRLLEPLGITDAFCSGRRLGDEFTRKVEGGGWGFHLTTDDMAKFSWFLEQKGCWEGKQLVDPAWIEAMSSRQIETDNPYYNNGNIRSNWLCGYGFQNWQCVLPGAWRADGAFGQFGIIMPEQDAVVIMTSSALNTEDQLNIVFNTLVPGMKIGATFDDALPANPKGLHALTHYVSHMQLPVLWGIKAPLVEKQYSGIRFKADSSSCPSVEDFIGGAGYFDKDGLSVKAVTFRFEGASAFLDFELNKMPEKVTPQFAYDPFSPASRVSPREDEHLICHDDDPATAVTQTLEVGMDGDFRTSHLTRFDYAASGCFISPSTFEILVRNPETVEAVRIRCTFFRGMLNLEAIGTIPEEGGLTMREQSGMHFSAED